MTCKCKGHPFNCFGHPIKCDCNVGSKTTEAILDLDRTDYGYNIATIAWNEAIEAAAKLAENEGYFNGGETIRKLKK